MPDIFGAAAGLEAGYASQRAKQLHELSMAKGELELDVARTAAESQKRMLELMNQADSQVGGRAWSWKASSWRLASRKWM
jgi:hypothetical protein